MIELYRKKIKEIKYHKFLEKIKIIVNIYKKKNFKHVISYLKQLKYIKLFNKNYKTNYYIDIEIIHLSKIIIGLDGVNLLLKIVFFNLIDISLNEVDINDFSSLKNPKFPKLKILSLGKNKITSIDFINSLPFPKLENLMLGVNLIQDLSPLKMYKSNIIKDLFLLENKINDITPLIDMDTPNLEILYLGSNIEDISPLIKCKFPKLKQLSFSHNKIQNITPLKDYNFSDLELLILSNNKIEKIGALFKAKFPKLNDITLKNNLINNISYLSKFPNSFPNLKKLDISKNKFSTGTDDFNTIIISLKKKIKNISY